jgi:flagellar motility protein MotE (MotC chaperone)
MTRILQSPWAIGLLGCLLYLGTTAALIHPDQLAQAQQARVAAEAPVSPNNEPSWKFRNPEFEQLVQELKQERQSVSIREQQLNELQARLEAERQEIFLVTQGVQKLQTDFDKGVVRMKQQETENLKRQAKVVAEMSPEGAATLLYEMPMDEMVRILFTLKPDGAGPILESLGKQGPTQAKRAADAANRLRLVLPP